MEKKDENKSNKSKLKNKKKDIITVENTSTYNNSSVNTLKNEEKLSKINEENEDEEANTIKGDINIEDINTDSNKNINFSTPSNINKIESNEDNNTIINKILFQTQLLAAMTNKLDEKLTYLLSTFISHEHLKGILEERDCREICSNLLCGENMKKVKQNEKKYYYNSSTTEFNKDSLLDFFCDIKCFQKFKELADICKNFDYFRLLNIETVFLFSILCDFYPKNLYLEEISKLAQIILNKNKKISKEILEDFKVKYVKYFTYEIQENKAKEEVISDLFTNLDISNK